MPKDGYKVSAPREGWSLSASTRATWVPSVPTIFCARGSLLEMTEVRSEGEPQPVAAHPLRPARAGGGPLSAESVAPAGVLTRLRAGPYNVTGEPGASAER